MDENFRYGFEKQALLSELGSAVKSTWSAAKPVVQKGMQSMAAVGKQAWKAAKPILQTGVKSVKNAFNNSVG